MCLKIAVVIVKSFFWVNLAQGSKRRQDKRKLSRSVFMMRAE